MARKRLGEILIEAGLITKSELSSALREQSRWGGAIGAILVREGYVTEETLVRALAKQLHLPLVSLGGQSVPATTLRLVDEEYARRHRLMPFRVEGKFLDVAIADPMSLSVADELRLLTKLNVRVHLAMPSEIDELIERHYGGADEVAIDFDDLELRPSGPRSDNLADMRDAEIASLQRRLATLESLVRRDEDVIRKLLSLLVEKGVASRDEVVAAIAS